MKQAVFEKYEICEDDLLGSGSESWVYGLDDDRVLRVSKGGFAAKQYFETLQHFYDRLPEMDFKLPIIFDVDEVEGSIVSIENRMDGQPFMSLLPNLSEPRRSTALLNYLEAAEALSGIKFPDLGYGEILKDVPVTSQAWSGFLCNVVKSAAAENELQADVPELAAVTHQTLALLSKLPDPVKSLVHGDYFPGNVMMDEDLNVTGVIDFSRMTVVGDPLMDIAASLLFLELADGYADNQTDTLNKIIIDKYGESFKGTIEAYRLYYSFYFSGARENQRLHRWCVRNLNSTGRNT